MKKWIIFLLIFIVLISIVFIAIGISSPKDNGNNKSGNSLNINNDKITGEIIKDDSRSGSISENAVGGRGSGGGSSSSSGGAGGSGGGGTENNPETTPDRELPSDLNTKPCGFYFLEYNTCTGVCPAGQCLVDEKSCYCQIV